MTQEQDMKTAQQLRKKAQELYPGRSADIRKLTKTQLSVMLNTHTDLDDMLESLESSGGGRGGKKPEAERDTSTSTSNGTLGKVLAEAVRDHIGQPELDMDEVRSLISEQVAEQIAEHKVVHLTVDLDGKKKDVGMAHKQFKELLAAISVRENAYLVGPAASGKTTAVKQAAEACSLSFYTMSVGLETSKFELFGYSDANGKYVRTPFRDAFEHGGVFLIDEIDAGHPGIITSINAATENGACGFPDGTIARHEDFVLIAAGNTYGTGANRQYVGRNQLDAATLDRFVFIEWGYDENIERHISGNSEWTKEVQAVRRAIGELGVRHIVSPRASRMGAKLLAQGVKKNAVRDMVLYKGLKSEDVRKIEQKVKEGQG